MAADSSDDGKPISINVCLLLTLYGENQPYAEFTWDKKSLTRSVEIISSMKQFHPSTLSIKTELDVSFAGQRKSYQKRKQWVQWERENSFQAEFQALKWLPESLCMACWCFFCLLVSPWKGNCQKTWPELAKIVFIGRAGQKERVWDINR